MKTTVSTKGQIVLPAELRELDRIRPGHVFEVERVDQGEYHLKLIQPEPNEGVIELLLNCPVKGWFVPFDRSETTDDIQSPSV